MSFLEKLAARMTGRREKVGLTYAALVQAVADDKPPAAEQAEAILADAGRSVDDLAAAVARLRGRRAARAVLDTAKAAPAELRRVEAALKAADARRQEAVDLAESEHAAAVGPLLDRHRALERTVEDGKRAELLLRDSAHEPAELAGLRSQLAEAKRQRDRYLQQAGKQQAAAQQAATGAQASGYSDSYKDGYKQEAQRQQAGAEQAIAAAEPHQREVARIEGLIAAAESLALTP